MHPAGSPRARVCTNSLTSTAPTSTVTVPSTTGTSGPRPATSTPQERPGWRSGRLPSWVCSPAEPCSSTAPVPCLSRRRRKKKCLISIYSPSLNPPVQTRALSVKTLINFDENLYKTFYLIYVRVVSLSVLLSGYRMFWEISVKQA